MPAKAPSHAGEPSDGRLQLALETYLARVNRREQPAGEWREGLWFPSSGERQACCEGIEPTAANRQALDSHCRTQGHVAVLYGVSVDDLRAVVRARRRAAKPPIARLRHRSPPEALYEMNREARNGGLEDLRAVSAEELRVLSQLPTLPGDDDLTESLEQAWGSAKRLAAAIHYSRTLETSLRYTEMVMSAATAGPFDGERVPEPRRPDVPR